MLLLLLNYVVLRALWKIDVFLISTLVNKSLYYLLSLLMTLLIVYTIARHSETMRRVNNLFQIIGFWFVMLQVSSVLYLLTCNTAVDLSYYRSNKYLMLRVSVLSVVV